VGCRGLFHVLRTRGRSIKTSNLYLGAVKSFCAWLVQDRRTADNPLAHIEGGNVKLDRRHDRQTLSGRAQLHDLGAAVNRLPPLAGGPATETNRLAATGTDDESPTSEVSRLVRCLRKQ
jgi:hypothetical protein